MNYEIIVFFVSLVFFIWFLCGIFFVYKQVLNINSELYKKLSKIWPFMIKYLKFFLPILAFFVVLKIFNLSMLLFYKLF